MLQYCREVMDSMHKPHRFPKVFTCSYLYVFTLTLPNAATVFAAFPVQSAQQGQSLGVTLLTRQSELKKISPKKRSHVCCLTFQINTLDQNEFVFEFVLNSTSQSSEVLHVTIGQHNACMY